LGKFDFRIPKKKREKIEKNRKNGKKMPGLTAGPTAMARDGQDPTLT